MRVGAGGRCGEEHLGRRAVRVLVEEVVFDRPCVVEAEPVGQYHLFGRLMQQVVLVVVGPRLGELVLVEDAELHRVSSAHLDPVTAVAGEKSVARIEPNVPVVAYQRLRRVHRTARCSPIRRSS